MGRVSGKVAIVTGAAKGLGEADARLRLGDAAFDGRHQFFKGRPRRVQNIQPGLGKIPQIHLMPKLAHTRIRRQNPSDHF